jgi:hypothetical protein
MLMKDMLCGLLILTKRAYVMLGSGSLCRVMVISYFMMVINMLFGLQIVTDFNFFIKSPKYL